MFEATISGGAGGQRGVVSQSGQWAPFNAAYTPIDAATNAIIANTSSTALNGYKGGSFQQAISAISNTDQECYELTGQCYSTYGFEYKAGFEGAVSAARARSSDGR
jgi:beta-glucanase (GH16 family)